MEVRNLYFVLIVTLSCHTGCQNLNFVDVPMSWKEARNYCRDNLSSSLACVSSNSSEKFLKHLNDGDIIWIGTYTTLSSWSNLVEKGCMKPIQAAQTFELEHNDLGTCQLICDEHESQYFGLKENVCICSNALSTTQCGEIPVPAYERLSQLDGVSVCKSLSCWNNVVEYANISNLLGNCNYNTEEYIRVCDTNKSGCLGLQQSIRHNCILYNLQCTHSNPIQCDSKPHWYLELNEVAVQYIGKASTTFEKILKGIQSKKHGQPVLKCYKGTVHSENQYQNKLKFTDTPNCIGEEQHRFFCEKKRNHGAKLCDLSDFYLKRMSPSSTVAFTTETTQSITTPRASTFELTTAITDFDTNSVSETNAKRNSTTEPSNRRNMVDESTGSYAGVVVGVSLPLILIILFTCLIIWKRLTHRKSENDDISQRFSNIPTTTNPSYESHPQEAPGSEYDFIIEPNEYQSIQPNEYAYADPDCSRNNIGKENVYVEPNFIPNKKVKIVPGNKDEEKMQKGRTNAGYEKSQNGLHDYVILQANDNTSPHNLSNNSKISGYEEPQNSEGNYFILEPKNSAYENKGGPVADYFDSAEGAYDHLHDKLLRKQQNNQNNLYAHTNTSGNSDSTYDTSIGNRPVRLSVH